MLQIRGQLNHAYDTTRSLEIRSTQSYMRIEIIIWSINYQLKIEIFSFYVFNTFAFVKL